MGCNQHDLPGAFAETAQVFAVGLAGVLERVVNVGARRPELEPADVATQVAADAHQVHVRILAAAALSCSPDQSVRQGPEGQGRGTP